MDRTSAHRFAREWVDAFNSGDLPRILSHYASDVELVSPLCLRFTDEASDMVTGTEALGRYFGTALARHPDLRFTLLEVGTGARGICIRYHTSLDDRIAMECIELTADGRASRVICHYVDAGVPAGEARPGSG